MPTTFFVTGTGTGVGKTVLAELLVRRLRAQQHQTRAFKPISSGGRADAQILWRAQGCGLALDAVNPWWFKDPVTPMVAARMAGRPLQLAAVCAHLRRWSRGAGVVVVEGAGGLLSPMGEHFASREVLVALRAIPILVAVNRLGMLNEVLLTLEALPPRQLRQAHLVVFTAAAPDESSATNLEVLAERFAPERTHLLPRGRVGGGGGLQLRGATARAIDTLLAAAWPRRARRRDQGT